MSFTKITTADLADKGVVGLPDTPNLSVTALQKKFDEIATDVIVPKFNNLVDELDDFEETADLSERVKSDEITNIRTDSDDKIQISRDNGTTWVSPSSSGHIIMDGTGRSYDQRSRLQFSANTVITDKESDNATFIQIPSGIKGDKGDAATIQVGTVTDATTASVTNVGSDKDAIFNFELPKGKDGNAATIQVGTVVTGTVASVSNRGTSSSAIFDFVLPKGDKGDTGTSFQIKGMYATYADLIAAHPTGSKGDAYAVGTSTTNTIYNWDTDQQSWVDLGGLKGAKGDDGAAATLTMGTVTTLDPDQSAYARNDGTTTNAILSLGLPKGAKGDTGAAATIAVGTVAKGETASVTNAGTTTNAVFNFVLPQGDKGDAGSPSIVNGKSGDSIVLYSSDIYHNSYTATTGDITSTDSVLECIEKLDGNLSEVKSDLSNLSNGSNVKVTFDSSLVGKSATLTKGTKVYTKTVGTDSTCLFKGIEEVGTFTLACDGNTMSVNLPCYSYYEFELGVYGFQGWLDSAGITTTFTSLAGVLADQPTVRILMTKHDSVDYLVEWLDNDDTLSATILASDNALKWIGLRDYAYDSMPSAFITSWLGGTKWEYALKDKVPTMTSNSAPYGEAYASSNYTSGSYVAQSYFAFDNSMSTMWTASSGANNYVGYKFTTPINVKKFRLAEGNETSRIKSFKLQASNDNSTWVDISDTKTFPQSFSDESYTVNNDDYYLYYRVYITEVYMTQPCIGILQFYGRSLSVSVPTMTSNTSPWGEVIFSSYNSGYEPWMAFDGVSAISSTGTKYGWQPSTTDSFKNAYIGYKFNEPILLKAVSMQCAKGSDGELNCNFSLYGANDDGVYSKIDSDAITFKFGTGVHIFSVDTDKTYKSYKVIYDSVDKNVINLGYGYDVNFYGLDYSEHSERHYIYDNGVEVEGVSVTSMATKNADNIYAKQNEIGSAGAYVPSIDLTNYNLQRAVIGSPLLADNNGYYPEFAVDVANSTPSSSASTHIANAKITSSYIPNNGYFDISSVNGNYEVVIAFRSGSVRNSEFSLVSWWLE